MRATTNHHEGAGECILLAPSHFVKEEIPMETMNIGGREYPVVGFVEDKRFGKLPLVDIPMMSDYQWHLRCLENRLENPEVYRQSGEDVEATIAKLRETLVGYGEAVEIC